MLDDTDIGQTVQLPILVKWSKDGHSIYYEWRNNLSRLDIESKKTAQITHFKEGGATPRYFAVSQDERSIAYVDSINGQFDIWTASLNGDTPTNLTNDDYVDQYPIWTPDGESIIYNSIRDNISRLFVFDLRSGKTAPVGPADLQAYLKDISDDGKRMLCLAKRDETDLFSVNIETEEEQNLTEDIGIEMWPSPSPLGDKFAYMSISGERFVADPDKSRLKIKDIGQQNEGDPLIDNASFPEWSPDGSRISFLTPSPKKGYSLETIQRAGGPATVLVDGLVTVGGFTSGPSYNRFNVKDYDWSADGKEIAYISFEGGPQNVWTVSADGSNRKQISDNGDLKTKANSPLWSPDTQKIAYVLAADQKKWSLLVKTTEGTQVVSETDSVMRLLGWSSNDELVIALVKNAPLSPITPSQITLVKVSLTTHKTHILQNLDQAYLTSVYLSPDKRNISFVSSLQDRDNIWIVPAGGGSSWMVTKNTDPKIYLSSLEWALDGKSLYFGKQTKSGLLIMLTNPK